MFRYTNCFLVLTMLVTVSNVTAQDIHFSQFYASPMNLNPSLTGSFDGQYRLVANDRNQWQSFTNGYRTFSASFDSKLKWGRIPESFFGAGLLLSSDKAGDGEFGNTQAGIALSFHYDVSGTGKYIVSAGIYPAFSQYGINFSRLRFSSQYNGEQYDPDLPSGENIITDNFVFFDMSTGLGFSAIINEKISVSSGVSVFHGFTPRVSFYDNAGVKLNRRYSFHSLIEYRYLNDLTFYPSFLLQKQGRLSEFVWGGMAKLSLNSLLVQSLYFGGWNRWDDAVVLKLGADYRSVTIGISYDINLSKLNQASNGKGGFEFSLAYIFNIRKLLPPVPYRQCPTYI